VSASTQNQALCGVLFLYKQVLGIELGWVDGVTRAKRPERVPVVLTREEVALVLGQMRGRDWLMASLMYGTGLRLMECVKLRRVAHGNRQAGDAAHVAPLFRDSFAGVGV
jgi:integrase